MCPFLDEMPIGWCVGFKHHVAAPRCREMTPLKCVDSGTQHLIRRAIDESFVSGFRCGMAIGAALAVASAVTLLLRSNAERG